VRAGSEAGISDLELGNHLRIFLRVEENQETRVEMAGLECFIITDKDLFKGA
jgi:hypothetical protein